MIPKPLQSATVEPSAEYENSEMMLYHAMIMEESGQVQDALVYLDKNAPSIRDKRSYSEARGCLCRSSTENSVF
jgi:hypothetical protein